jgi:hypothetical protein
MIWTTWRQFRAQAIVAGALIAVIAVVLLVSGLSLAAAYNDAGLNSCHASCATDASNFINTLRGSSYQLLFYGGIGILYLAPALIGLFWGAPLIARELETGTSRLSWNQSVTRTRWTVAKLGVVGLAAVATAGLISLMVSWWASPIDHALSFGSANTPAGHVFTGPATQPCLGPNSGQLHKHMRHAGGQLHQSGKGSRHRAHLLWRHRPGLRVGPHRHLLGRAANHAGDRVRHVPAGPESERHWTGRTGALHAHRPYAHWQRPWAWPGRSARRLSACPAGAGSWPPMTGRRSLKSRAAGPRRRRRPGCRAPQRPPVSCLPRCATSPAEPPNLRRSPARSARPAGPGPW